MDRKKVILLVAALLIAAVTAFMARSMFSGGQTAPAAVAKAPEPTGPQVLVATRALPVGTILTADAFRFQPWPEELVEQAYFQQGEGEGDPLKDLLGTVVRNPITAGQPITQGSIVSPGDRGFLAAALGPGMRAVTVQVNDITGVAGFVFPGDRVDLLLTQQVRANRDEDLPLRASETIIRNVRVLATDQRPTQSVDEKGNTIVAPFRMVTLEVTPIIAERISVAMTIGTISLSLRSLAENQAELEQALASGKLNMPKGATAEEEQAIIASASKQPIAGSSSYATGGQVSRFQRTTVPAITPVQRAVESVRVQQETQQAVKQIRGPIVRVYRADRTPEEVEINKLKQR
jgi:pilus assembly protein CpaB